MNNVAKFQKQGAKNTSNIDGSSDGNCEPGSDTSSLYSKMRQAFRDAGYSWNTEWAGILIRLPKTQVAPGRFIIRVGDEVFAVVSRAAIGAPKDDSGVPCRVQGYLIGPKAQETARRLKHRHG